MTESSRKAAEELVGTLRLPSRPKSSQWSSYMFTDVKSQVTGDALLRCKCRQRHRARLFNVKVDGYNIKRSSRCCQP